MLPYRIADIVFSARIKLHRYSAFFDLPLFSQKHCDLKSSARQKDGQGPETLPMCSCNTLNRLHSIPSIGSSPEDQWSSRRLSNTFVWPQEGSLDSSPNILALGDRTSTKICLKSALNIAQSFESLPYPNPSGSLRDFSDEHSRVQTWKTTTPRTMPTFACCAMQSSYALLMIRHRAEIMGSSSPTDNPMVSKLFDQLQHGLQSVVGALENYSIAFEALGGMKGE
jgi:hypothetical protein